MELGPSYLNRVAGVEALGGDERDAMDAEKEDKEEGVDDRTRATL